MKKSTLIFAAVALAAILAPQEAAACAVCMGDPNSRVAGASNGMMLFLLGILALVFTLIGGFAYMIYRQAQAPMPPHVELGDMVDTQPSGPIGN